MQFLIQVFICNIWRTHTIYTWQDKLKAMSHEAIFLATCNAMALHCKLQGKLPRVTPHVCNYIQRKIALQVAEKVEAASTFRNATGQVQACDTPTASCLVIF